MTPAVEELRQDTHAIQLVLNRYRDAMSVLDVAGVRAVWPTVDVAALEREFARVNERSLVFDACRITSSQTQATASCDGTIASGLIVGGRRPRVERTRWQVTLRMSGQRWIITAVEKLTG